MKSLLAVGLLLAALAAQAQESAREFKNKLDGIQSMQGQFEQVVTGQQGETIQTSSGEFTVKRPGYLRWHSFDPFAQIIIGTPEKLWIYDPDLEQATLRAPQDEQEGNPAQLLSGDLQGIEDYFVVTEPPNEKGRVFELQPKSDQATYKKITFYFLEGALEAFEFVDRMDQMTRVQFSDLETNVEVPVSVFEFEPPRGTDIIVDD